MYSNSLDGTGSDKTKVRRDAAKQVTRWVKTRPTPMKIGLGFLVAVVMLVLMYFIIEDHDVLFILAEICHVIGLLVLVFKLQQKKSAAGLSLRTQNLTAAFLAVRLYCSFMMEYDIHTLLDLVTLAATSWVIFTMLTSAKHTWQADKDTIPEYFVLIPCACLALVSHPGTRHLLINRVLWAFCVYVEAVSVLPQLRMMQKNKVVEKFTGHYVFALGMARFFSCAHWVLQMADGSSHFLWQALGSGLWPMMVLVSEIVQTFILADFCYFYVKAYATGVDLVQLPAGIV